MSTVRISQATSISRARWLIALCALALAGGACAKSAQTEPAATDPSSSTNAMPSTSTSSATVPSDTTEPADTTEPTDTTVPADTTGPTTTGPTDTQPVVWPPASGSISYDSPTAAAVGFARDFVGFTDPVAGEFRQGDSRSGEVEIRPEADGPVTTVLVRQVGSDNRWSVIGSVAASIQIAQPSPGESIAMPAGTAPYNATGNSTAFEAVVNYMIKSRDNITLAPEASFMGGSNGEMGPFSTPLEFQNPSGATEGSLITFTRSAKDGSIVEASVVPVRF